MKRITRIEYDHDSKQFVFIEIYGKHEKTYEPLPIWAAIKKMQDVHAGEGGNEDGTS